MQTMQRTAIETKVEYLPISIKAVGDEAQGIIQGHLSTYDLDLGQDKVVRGAFKESIKEAQAQRAKSGSPFMWKLLWNHSGDTLPIGGITSAIEDSKGLLISAKLDLAQPLAQQCYDAVKFGSIDSMSIGYKTIDSSFEHDAATGKTVRLLKQIDLKEGSLVLWPMQPAATISSVKNLDTKEGRVLSTATVKVLKRAVDGITGHVNDVQQHMNAQRQNALSGFPVYGSSSSSESYDISSAIEALNDMLEGKEGRAISAETHTRIAQATTNIMKHVKIIKDLVHEQDDFNRLAGQRIYSSSSSEIFEEKEEEDPLVAELREMRESLTPSSRTLEDQMDELNTKISVNLAMARLYSERGED